MMAAVPPLVAVAIVLAHGVAVSLVARRVISRRDRWLCLVPAVGHAVVALAGRGSPRRRALALAAGAAASYLLTVGAAFGLAISIGAGRSAFAVSEVTPGSPSDGVLAPGDHLLSIDGQPFDIETGATPHALIQRAGGRTVTVEYRRDRRTVAGRLTPVAVDGDFRVGVRVVPFDVLEPMTAGEAIIFAAAHPLRRIRDIAASVKQLVAPDDEAFMGPPSEHSSDSLIPHRPGTPRWGAIGIVEQLSRAQQPDAESLLDLACSMFVLLIAMDALFIAVTVGGALRGRSDTVR